MLRKIYLFYLIAPYINLFQELTVVDKLFLITALFISGPLRPIVAFFLQTLVAVLAAAVVNKYIILDINKYPPA